MTPLEGHITSLWREQEWIQDVHLVWGTVAEVRNTTKSSLPVKTRTGGPVLHTPWAIRTTEPHNRTAVGRSTEDTVSASDKYVEIFVPIPVSQGGRSSFARHSPRPPSTLPQEHGDAPVCQWTGRYGFLKTSGR